jgi:RNA polymerase sigma-70 factor (ECF subfamily)
MVQPGVEIPAVAAQPWDFEALMRAEQKRVFLLCLRFLEDRDEADTVTQEVFLKAYRALSGPYDSQPADLSRWLTRVTVNACLDRVRSQRWRFWRKRPTADSENLILSLARDASPTLEDRVFARQIGVRLAAALGGLSERQRSVFILKHYEDRSLDEIAGILGLDVGTVKSHLARALAKLRVELRDLYFGKHKR